MATTSPVTKIVWDPMTGRVTPEPVNVSPLTLINLYDDVPLAEGSSDLEGFLNEFDTHPDIAVNLSAAKVDVANMLSDALGGDTLRTLRMKAGLSQSDLAKRMSTSQSHLSRLEARKESPTEATLRALSRALSVDFNTLMKALARAAE
jgi:DNA-binding transcriptional regulator YiaG